jgi:hypothetical protein
MQSSEPRKRLNIIYPKQIDLSRTFYGKTLIFKNIQAKNSTKITIDKIIIVCYAQEKYINVYANDYLSKA